MEDLFNQFSREVRREQDPEFQYLPPVSMSLSGPQARWERVRANDPDVGWDAGKLLDVMQWVETKRSRAFVVLLEGRILCHAEWGSDAESTANESTTSSSRSASAIASTTMAYRVHGNSGGRTANDTHAAI